MKFFLKLLFSLSFFLFHFSSLFAAGSTILPEYDMPGDNKEQDCQKFLEDKGYDPKTKEFSEIVQEQNFNKDKELQTKYLSCAIRSGDMHLWMIPYFLVYWIEFLIQLSGILAVLMFVIGGIAYMLGGGLIETISKDAGKKMMTWALIGMIIAFLAWVIVNVVLGFVSQ
ncbi:hypothetical protein A2335_03880 [Candidatus Peregrinibacteria bacterium RIFOXYB2_FULL_32_7]|nr:MAG: hypothetical protein A2335_03880 [Candidatus Peregrinibacteria bacterium RIFOXYB2_FULL_32_7]